MKRFSRRAFVSGVTAGSAMLAGCGTLIDSGSSSDEYETYDQDIIDQIADSDRPMLGNDDAETTVFVFEDFKCPSCQQFKLQSFPAISNNYIDDGHIRYFHVDSPLPYHDPLSYEIANAGREMFEVGGDGAFWEFAQRIYENQEEADYAEIESIASDIVDDGISVRQAAVNRKHNEILDRDMEFAHDLEISGTPTIIIDNSNIPVNDVLDVLEERTGVSQ